MPAETAAPERQDSAAWLFRQKCAGCHTIGGGATVAPDLQAVQGRPKEEIAANVRRMQDRAGALTDAEIDDLTMLLLDRAAAERIAAQEKQAAKAAAGKLAPPSADTGRRLFAGQHRLRNGGAACIDCHRVNGRGGTIGLDLTDVAARLGASGLPSTIQQANFPVMKDAYKKHPITPQEAADIAAYLVSAPQTPAGQNAENTIPWLALAGALAMLGLVAVSYRKRNTGVRSRLQRR